MAVYDFRCTECGFEIEDSASMNGYQDHHPSCPKCNNSMNYFWSPTVVQFALKDGQSGSWPSKGNRFKQFRQKASEQAAIRQKERFGDGKRAIPNYNSVEMEDWHQAKSEAIKDRGLEVAASYDAKIAETEQKKLLT